MELTKTRLGTVREIRRYPVKSFGGEALEACMVEETGLEGDRICAFYDESREGWQRFITARALPDMLAYEARYADGEVWIQTPDGRVLEWGPRLLEEIQRKSRATVTLSEPFAPHPEQEGLLSVDGASLLLLTDAGLRRLEERWGQRLDPRRFRPNLILNVDDEAPDDGQWVGKRVSAGDAELRIDSLCERCSLITIDPDTRTRDASLLRTVKEELDLCFGLYASVVKPGMIRVGDEVRFY
ncbi:MOSC domain-containing protein [Paenibacillus glufosinatiresistens]|uniref:MOSC domain-containing protein n=1 Tax=Paenibacillus glufosinatiresistens TaxID=3070657 RepID=UPI00286E7AF6|nr:MOSC domain-containing protein [Paenibacillus sp. YX.27]